MNTHIRHMVKRIVDEDPEFGDDGNEEMIALAINHLIRDMAKGIVEKYPDAAARCPGVKFVPPWRSSRSQNFLS